MATPPDLEHGVAPFGPPAPVQLPLLDRGVGSSWPPPLASGMTKTKQPTLGHT